MERTLFRTNASDLSDDELRLLDVQFGAAVPLCCLPRQRFTATFNQPCHALDDDALRRAVGRLCGLGILETERHRDETYVRLTNRGGELWSGERCPIWERYATEHYGETISGKQFATVKAISETTCEDFVRLGGPGWDISHDMSHTRVRMFAIRRHTLIYWRPFPNLFAAVVMNLKDGPCPVDPEWRRRLLEREHHRTWWRNVFELQKFVPSA
jgi:hypothetical protein